MAPRIPEDTIRELWFMYGDRDMPVEEYCIGCGNCEFHGFPCANCAWYVFQGHLGEGTGLDWVPEDEDELEGPSTPRKEKEE